MKIQKGNDQDHPGGESICQSSEGVLGAGGKRKLGTEDVGGKPGSTVIPQPHEEVSRRRKHVRKGQLGESTKMALSRALSSQT